LKIQDKIIPLLILGGRGKKALVLKRRGETADLRVFNETPSSLSRSRIMGNLPPAHGKTVLTSVIAQKEKKTGTKISRTPHPEVIWFAGCPKKIFLFNTLIRISGKSRVEERENAVSKGRNDIGLASGNREVIICVSRFEQVR